MQHQDMGDLLETLKTMGELELSVAQFYQTCGELWPEHHEFWTDMKYAEMKHADNVARMARILEERPENFQTGRFIVPTTVKMFIADIQSKIERLKSQEVDEKKGLSLGLGFEQSYLESKYAEIVRTDDHEFKSLVREINADTVFHREYLSGKLREWVS